ncbi:unnamed protein product [Vitrella brassicaformis CCMP3155]|uniref:Uncharacterized protein n=1 Tax=Vitrella brassicaformis (strain CCMP3155) TaxID=1169540 RepID=A0A0G4EBT6_VITBC|nr:unnamed protein product [Vitrella brassicaformis CCMP3155]|eukprot:CEL92991.1 unnamed protein product [Vitrella brassicaformis CCMP3155]
MMRWQGLFGRRHSSPSQNRPPKAGSTNGTIPTAAKKRDPMASSGTQGGGDIPPFPFPPTPRMPSTHPAIERLNTALAIQAVEKLLKLEMVQKVGQWFINQAAQQLGAGLALFAREEGIGEGARQAEAQRLEQEFHRRFNALVSRATGGDARLAENLQRMEVRDQGRPLTPQQEIFLTEWMAAGRQEQQRKEVQHLFALRQKADELWQQLGMVGGGTGETGGSTRATAPFPGDDWEPHFKTLEWMEGTTGQEVMVYMMSNNNNNQPGGRGTAGGVVMGSAPATISSTTPATAGPSPATGTSSSSAAAATAAASISTTGPAVIPSMAPPAP